MFYSQSESTSNCEQQPYSNQIETKLNLSYYPRDAYFINIILLIITLLARQDQAVFGSLNKAGGTAVLSHSLQISTFFNSKIDTDLLWNSSHQISQSATGKNRTWQRKKIINLFLEDQITFVFFSACTSFMLWHDTVWLNVVGALERAPNLPLWQISGLIVKIENWFKLAESVLLRMVCGVLNNNILGV